MTPLRPNARHWAALLLLAGAALAIDQWSKAAIIARLYPGETVIPIPALGEVFRIVRSQNTGAAFGMFSGAGDIFSIIAVVAVIGMLIVHGRSAAGAWTQRIGMGLVMGGALGNVIDRLQHGHVVDFINYRIPGVISNVSNLADHAIVGGVLILVWLSWKTPDAPLAPVTQESPPTPEG